MGEKSKFIGDVGEDAVAAILKIVGWSNFSQNIELPCVTSAHEKKTHGIDVLFLYNSPLESNTVENVVVSSKFSSNPYSSVPSTFKSHLKDLANTLECYSKSQERSEQNKIFNKSFRKNDTGVLFYINNDRDPNNQSIIDQISSTRLDSSLKFKTIYVIDNKRANFLYNSISYIRSNYDEKLINFYYPATSLNLTSLERNYHSKIMPVEFLTSPVIPLIIEQDAKQPIFTLISEQSFTEETFEMLLGCARDLICDITTNLLFLFPSFDQTNDQRIIEKVLMTLNRDDRKFTVDVRSFTTSFLGQNNG